MSKMTIIVILLTVFYADYTSKAFGYTDKDVDRLVSRATIYGRAVACGVGTDTVENKAFIRETMEWMALTFGSDVDVYFKMFNIIGRLNGENQILGGVLGRTSESCDSILRSFKSNGL